MCQAFCLQYKWDAISGMPTNLYGPNDNFRPEISHVLPALIRRFHESQVCHISLKARSILLLDYVISLEVCQA
jgi:nucleoside-diphosphate-sugar epimerase